MKNGDSSDDEGVEEEVKGGNPAIAGDDEVCSGIGRCLARAARYPSDATGVLQLLRCGRGRVLEVRMRRPDLARDPIDLVPAPVNAPRLVEGAVLGIDVIDGRPPADWVALAEYLAKVAEQQGRDAVGHGRSPSFWQVER